MVKVYKTTALTKKGGDREWVLYTLAKNAKEADARARALWENTPRLSHLHLFHIETRVEKHPDAILPELISAQSWRSMK